MILNKLHEALVEIAAQRRALDEVEAQLRTMIAKLSGLPDIPGTSNSHSVGTSRRNVNGERDKLDDITDILREEGRPLHITVIAERLSAIYGKKIERTEIEPGLNRHVSSVKKRRIEKFAPSTFGLPEWKVQPTLAQIAS